MVPRRDLVAQLREEDVGEYGRILYENSKHFNEWAVTKTKLSGVAFVGLGIFSIIIPIFTYEDTPQILIMPVIGIFCLFLGIMFYKEAGGEFRIHERGIRFSYHKIPFLTFEEIDHIEKRESLKRYSPFTHIMTIDEKSYYISSEPMKYVTETPENYHEFIRILEKKLLETHPNENPVKLIWDVYNVPWERDALEELDKIKFSRRMTMVQVNEKVLEEGRFRVTLGDFIRYK